jgi:hypothetical protein
MKLQRETCPWHLFLNLAVFAVMAWPAATMGQTDQSNTPFSVYFPHYAAGGGYATTFTFINTGNTTATGTLWFWDPEGNPRTPVEIVVSPKGVGSYRMQGSTLRIGWAKYEGEGGIIAGVATFEYAETGGILKSIAGVQAYPPTGSATIAVDYEPDLELDTAYAIVNPGTDTMLVALEAFSEEGAPLDEPKYLALPPSHKISRYVYQDFPSLDRFHGTVVFSSMTGNNFIITTLAQNKGLYTVMPVVPGTAH